MLPKQSYYSQINYMRLFLLICLFSVILVVCFFVIFALEEGGEANTVYYIAQWIFRLIAFPSYIFSKTSFLNNLPGLILSIIIGVLSYSLLIETIIIRYRSDN
jgi:hypothetical protein